MVRVEIALGLSWARRNRIVAEVDRLGYRVQCLDQDDVEGLQVIAEDVLPRLR